MGQREGWITGDQMRAELRAAGASVSDFQIERWRRQKLLPRPQQIGRGHGRGSVVWVPPDSASQAIEIARLFQIRKKGDWVGWQLWLRGYWVDDRYWQPALKGARSMLSDVRKAARIFERETERREIDPQALKEAATTVLRHTPVYAPLAKVVPDMVETLIGFGKEIMLGDFSRFTLGDDGNQELAAVIAVMGIGRADRDNIGGQALNLAGSVEPSLREVSAAFENLDRRRSVIEPSVELRREFMRVMEIATELYRSTSWLFGRSALGLGTINRIAANPSTAIQAAMLTGWVELRKVSKTLLSASEIEALHKEAIALPELAGQLQDRIAAASPGSPIGNLAQLRKAIAKPVRN